MSYAIDTAINTLGLGASHIKHCILLVLVFINYVTEINFLVIFHVHFQCSTKTDNLSMTILVACLFGCLAFGCLYFGYFADKGGRINSLKVSTVGVFYFDILGLVFIESYQGFVLTKMFQLFFTGGTTGVAIVYFLEHLPAKFRGRFMLLFTAVGMGFGYATLLLRLYLDDSKNGIHYFLLCEKLATFVVVLLVLSFEESIRYNNLTGRYDRTMKQLHAISKQHKTALPNGNLIMDKAYNFARISSLFSRRLAAITICLFTLGSLILTVYNGVMEWTLYLFSRDLGYMRYSQPHAVSCIEGEKSRHAFFYYIIICFVEIPSMLFFFFTLEWIGRKYTMLLATAASAILCAVLAFDINSMANILSLEILRGIISALTMVFFLYTAELYPTKIRCSGVGFQLFMGTIFSVLLTVLTEQLLQNSSGMAGITLMTFSMFGTVLIALIPKDTRGKHLDR